MKCRCTLVETTLAHAIGVIQKKIARRLEVEYSISELSKQGDVQRLEPHDHFLTVDEENQ